MYKMLIADDEQTIRNGIRNLVESFQLNISIVGLAEDGEQTLKMIDEFQPQIVLLDINMPFINGIEIAKYLNEHFPLTKTIIISGYDDFKYAQQAITYNVHQYLLKPIDFRQFKSILENAIMEYDKDYMERIKLNQIEPIVCDVTDINQLSVNYINDNFEDNTLTLMSAAKALSISDSYLSKIVKDSCGKSFTDYVNDLRIRSAKNLLRNTNSSINDIALAVGFSTQHYFSRVFKKNVNLSPVQYRKQYAK